MSEHLEYDFADKAWQVVLGCDNTIPCWKECWASKTVKRWHEPAIGPIDWSGWEFLSWLVVGGTSGAKAAPFDLQWARDAIAWGRSHKVPIKIKQIGSHPVQPRGCSITVTKDDRRGSDWNAWPPDIRVRQMPEVHRAQ